MENKVASDDKFVEIVAAIERRE